MRYLRFAIVAVAVAAALAPLPSTFIERQYSHGLYLTLQPFITLASSLVPVALLDVGVGLLVVSALIRLARRWRKDGFGAAGRRAAVSSVVVAAVLYLWFLAFWGLNYRRVPLEQKLAYDRSRVTREHGLQFGRLAVEQANALQASPGFSSGDQQALSYAFASVESWLGATKHALVAQPKRSLAMWYFRKAAIDGMTDPFFLEIIVNPDLLPFERPFVLAHEWALLAGYADESEANF
ncbi:MAG: DUF3810 family protein, partial [Vicinamibacterales bacterium]